MNFNNFSIRRPFTAIFSGLFFVTCFLTPSLFDEFFYAGKLKLLFYGLNLTLLGLVFYYRKKNLSQPIDNYALLFITGMSIFIFGLVLGSIFSHLSISPRRIIARIAYLTTLLITIYYTNPRIIQRCMKIYSNILVVFTLGAIITFGLTSIGYNPVSFLVRDDNGREYLNYIFGLALSVGGNIFHLKRALSFYDEPGTFAMMLLPAFFWFAIADFSYIKLAIIFLGLLLTFSVGGWLTLILSLILIFFILGSQKNSLQQRRLLIKTTVIYPILLLSLVAIYLIGSEFLTLDYLQIYGYNKFIVAQGTNSSGATRLSELSFLLSDFIFNHPLGLGANPNLIKEINYGISLEIVYNILESGILGLLGYCLMFIATLGMFWRLMKKNIQVSQTTIALAGGIFSLLLMTLQRANMFSIPMGIIMYGFFVRSYLESQKKKNDLYILDTRSFDSYSEISQGK